MTSAGGCGLSLCLLPGPAPINADEIVSVPNPAEAPSTRLWDSL